MTKQPTNRLPIAVHQFLSKTGVNEETRLLVGVSGGMDSMVLLNILFELGSSISVAHVNFNLRGEESDQDAAFVGDWCKQRNIPFYILNKITKTVEAELRINTQTAARKIRYEWWDRLLVKHQFDYVCTAHHLDDSMETLLINLFRGSGLKGLRGIPQIRGKYIRPLLQCTKASIEAYALEFDIPYRTDSSNLTDAYQRNRIRHHLIPMIQEMYPGLHASMNQTISRINTEWETIDFEYNRWVANHIKISTQGIRIEAHKDTAAFTLRWLEKQGFPWPLAADFVLANDHDTGHFLEHNHQRLSRTDFGYFLQTIQAPISVSIEAPGAYSFDEFEFVVKEIEDRSKITFDDPWTVYASSSVINWPLTIRNVEPGDVFQPFGMAGKHKKLQDLMVDLKLELFEKQKLLVLENNTHILWVIGKRLDDRARIKEGENTIIQLSFKAKQND